MAAFFYYYWELHMVLYCWFLLSYSTWFCEIWKNEKALKIYTKRAYRNGSKYHRKVTGVYFATFINKIHHVWCRMCIVALRFLLHMLWCTTNHIRGLTSNHEIRQNLNTKSNDCSATNLHDYGLDFFYPEHLRMEDKFF